MVGQRRVLALQMEKLKTQNPYGFCGNVMTDDQVEQLRKQIAVYAVICEQLVDMHKAFTAQQDLAGMKMGSVYGDLMAFGGNKVTARQRWTPSNMQLEILERIYDEANGTPGKHRVKEITKKLSQHGQVTETNVYNWFQNRRARTKRKQSVPTRNISDSDIEPEVISPKDKKTKPEDMYFQSPDSGIHLYHFDRSYTSPILFKDHIYEEFDYASLIKHSMFSQELEMTKLKLEMGADDDEKMRMYERAQMAVEACEMELLEKTRKYEELMLERHKKTMQIQQLDKIVRLKLAEADMFQLKANEAKQEVLRLQRIALVSEEECANRYLRQRLREAEAEKRYLIEKIRVKDHSQASNKCGDSGGPSQMLIHSKMVYLQYCANPMTDFSNAF